MELYFYAAECGDAARIRFRGTDQKNHNILIDSGFERTYRTILSKEIAALATNQELIDLWIISHIHADHIGGAVAHIQSVLCNSILNTVQRWYYNIPRTLTASTPKLFEISSPTSIDQGDILTNFLVQKDLNTQPDISTASKPIDLFGLKLIVLSPTPHQIGSLRKKYSTGVPLERNEMESISSAVAIKQNDYSTPLDCFELGTWEEDGSVENGSSISVLTELDGKRVIWLADAFPSTVADSLKNLGFSKENKIKCDWVKVSHHASKANNSEALYDLIDCSNYLISADGQNKHFLPHKECIARILRSSSRKSGIKYHFYFTHDNPTLRQIFQVDGSEIYDQLNFEIHFTQNNCWSFEI